MSPQSKLIAIPAACAAAALLIAGALIAIENHLGREVRVVPIVEQTAPAVLATLGITWIVLVAMVGRLAMAGKSLRFRLMYFAGSLIAQLAIVGMLLLASVLWNPRFLGANQIEGCSDSPDGQTRACLYSGGLLCGYEVWSGARHGWTFTRRASIVKNCTNLVHGATIGWQSDGTPTAVGPNGAAISVDPWPDRPLLR